MSPRVIIIGAGPGGLSCAHALLARGFRVEVFERGPCLSEGGAGILLQINAGKLLDKLGLYASLVATGVALRAGRIENLRGDCLVDAHYERANVRYGCANLSLSRRALLVVLQRELTADCVRFDRGVHELVERERGVDVICEDGSIHRADLVIACDGIHSRVRRQLFGPAVATYAGYTCWRGIVRHEGRVDPEAALVERWHRGLRLGTLPLDGCSTYVFATQTTAAGGADGDDPEAEFRRRFTDFAKSTAWVFAGSFAGSLQRDDIWRMPTLTGWVKGRVGLLGDAAHPMTPNLGQGAGQAIEDAVALADGLARYRDDLPRGLRYYERVRRRRARGFVVASRHFGALATSSHPWLCAVRDRLLRSTRHTGGNWWVDRQHRWLYGSP